MDDDGAVFLDPTVLSNFASTGSVAFLVELLDRPLLVPAVRDELVAGREACHSFLGDAIDSIGTHIDIVEPTGKRELESYREHLDPGEAETVRASIENRGMLASDDIAAREFARSRGVSVTGSVGLLALGIERGVIDVDTADRWLATWRRERDFYSPVGRVQNVLEEE